MAAESRQILLEDSSYPPITIRSVQLNHLSDKLLSNFLATATSNIIGVGASYGTKCVLEAIAFSTGSNALLVNMGGGVIPKKNLLLRDTILCHSSYRKHGFNMDKIASALYLDFSVPIQGAFDIKHKCHPRGSRAAISAVLNLERESKSFRNNIVRAFRNEKSSNPPGEQLVLRAWAAFIVASRSMMQAVPAIDTKTPNPLEIEFLAKCVRDANRQDALKPTTIKNNVSPKASLEGGSVSLMCTQYKTRLRVSENQRIKLETSKGTVLGRTVRAEGKTAKVSTKQNIGEGPIHSVVTIGKEEPTNAEIRRSGIILNAFQGSQDLFNCAFVRKIFFPAFPAHQLRWPAPLSGQAPAIYFPHRPLNDSQRKAVEFCLCRKADSHIGLIRGPPGTGKTTVIAACVTSVIKGTNNGTVWIVAQSNVAVKNVAEKLAESDFLDFRLLVSNEFHFEWHEHLYHRIEGNVIDSSDFGESIIDNARRIGNARVILCTISMLSNQMMLSGGFPQLVPIQTMIVDEASQIEVGDYIPLLFQFNSSLRKLVLIGDDCQLAPYGQEEIGDLRSVFEMSHLRKTALFLDTQYRMPTAIGDFISRYVYNGRLKSVHSIVSSLCCRFVDVADGVETQPEGSHSRINTAEVNAIIQVAKKYRREGKQFRIITAYDAQRNLLEKALESANLAWKDTCFNVDSFQGNEDDHIILSVVRTAKPGFLNNVRRLNVMLTRCKKSMLIFSNKAFLRKRDIKSTLLGRLAAEWMDKSAKPWVSVEQILNET